MMRFGALVLLVFATAPLVGAEKDKKPKLKLTLGKETTYVTGPLDEEGRIDYVAAVNERLGKGIAPLKNANVLLWQSFGPKPEGGKGMPEEFYKAMGIEPLPEKGDYFVWLRHYAKDTLKLDQGEETDKLFASLSRCGQRPWKAMDHPDIAAWLAINDKPLALVVEATNRPAYFSPLTPFRQKGEPTLLLSALLPGVQKCRELGGVLVARAMLRASEGRTDEAWKDLIACHRLARHIGRGGTLIEQLVGVTLDTIASKADVAFLEESKLSPKQIKERINELQKLPALPKPADAVDLTERFSGLQIVLVIGERPASLEGMLPGGRPKVGIKLKTEALDWDQALRVVNQWFDRLSAALRLKGPGEREKALAELENKLVTMKANLVGSEEFDKLFQGQEVKNGGKMLGELVVTLMLPAGRKVQHAADRAEQQQSNLHVAFALAAYQRDKGAYPEKLEALAPNYLAKVPSDLFSGKALVYKAAKDSYLLYSVGVNGKDEGGRSVEDDPRGDDLTIRVPFPKWK